MDVCTGLYPLISRSNCRLGHLTAPFSPSCRAPRVCTPEGLLSTAAFVLFGRDPRGQGSVSWKRQAHSSVKNIGMVKPGGRSKGGKGGKGKGTGTSGGGSSGSAPSSPTRRLKKGGKRGRRLCHMDGCTLCPSFGFEGEVAVSCSHHKEPGMRNLTARRCQHEGCFTVANFGMPGDKPGFCAAHSTKGMVNRNKPRGAEGVLAGVPIARSSRRAAKANTAIHSSSEAARARAGASEVTTRSSYRSSYSTSSSTESSSGQTSAADGDEGDDVIRFLTRRSGSTPQLSALTGDSEEELGCEDDEANLRRKASGAKLKSKGGDRATTCAPALTTSPGPSTTFVARGADPPELPDPTQYSQKCPDLNKSANGVSRVRARGSAAVATQEVFLAAHSGMKAAQRSHGDSLLLGGVQRVPTASVETSFPGESRNASMKDGPKDIMGAFLIDGPGLDASLDCNLTMDLSSSLDELLSAQDSLETRGKTEDPAVQGSRVSSVMRCSTVLRPANSLGLVSSAGVDTSVTTVACAMDCEGEVFVGDGEDFALTSIPGLNGMDLANLTPVGDGSSGLSESTRQAPASHPPPSSNGTSASLGLNLGILSANGGAPPPSSPRVCSNDLASSETPNSASEAPALASAHIPASAPPVLPSEDAWWDVLEEDYVAMPEPIWGVNLSDQGLDDEPRTHEQSRTHEIARNWRSGMPLPRGGAGVNSASFLDSGNPSVTRDSMQGIGLDVKTPPLMQSSLGLGGSMGMSDDGFVEDKARNDRGATSPVFRFLSCRPPGERDDIVETGGIRLSPKKRPRLPSAGGMSIIVSLRIASVTSSTYN